MLGYTEDELRRLGWQSLLHPEDDAAPDGHTAFRDASGVERCFRHKNGMPVWIRLTTTYAFDDNNRPFLGIAVAEDITARRRAEEALRASHDDLERRVAQRSRELQQEIAERLYAEDAARENERKFRALIENALDFIAVVDGDGIIRFQSPSVEGTLGYKPLAMVGLSAFALSIPRTWAAFATSSPPDCRRRILSSPCDSGYATPTAHGGGSKPSGRICCTIRPSAAW